MKKFEVIHMEIIRMSNNLRHELESKIGINTYHVMPQGALTLKARFSKGASDRVFSLDFQIEQLLRNNK